MHVIRQNTHSSSDVQTQTIRGAHLDGYHITEWDTFQKRGPMFAAFHARHDLLAVMPASLPPLVHPGDMAWHGMLGVCGMDRGEAACSRQLTLLRNTPASGAPLRLPAPMSRPPPALRHLDTTRIAT